MGEDPELERDQSGSRGGSTLPHHGVRRRFWLECGLAGLSCLLAIGTILWPEWIEILFGVDPDHGNGILEVLITVVTVVASLAFVVASRLEWKRGAGAPKTAEGRQ